MPYAATAAAVVVALRDGAALQVAIAHPTSIAGGHNLGGEPRDTIGLPPTTFVTVDGAAEELARRGAWARCVQALGALDAAVEFSVAHTREREQFGRPLSAFQAVQHTLASMVGEVERARPPPSWPSPPSPTTDSKAPKPITRSRWPRWSWAASCRRSSPPHINCTVRSG